MSHPVGLENIPILFFARLGPLSNFAFDGESITLSNVALVALFARGFCVMLSNSDQLLGFLIIMVGTGIRKQIF